MNPTPTEPQTVLALIAVGNDESATPAQRPLLAALLTSCISGDVMVGLVTSSLLDDPDMAAAVDPDCLAQNVGSEQYSSDLWSVFAESGDADFEDLPPAAQVAVVGPLLACVSFGQVMSSTAPAGVELSQPTIDCIDTAIDADTLIDAFTGTTDIGNVIGPIFLGCLTPEEFAAFANS